MKIAFFCGSPAQYDSGLHIYSVHLIKSILSCGLSIDSRLLYIISRNSLFSKKSALFDIDLEKIPIPIPEKISLRLWYAFSAPPIDIWCHGADVVHSTVTYLPPVRRAKTIATVHDIIPITHPEISVLSKQKAKFIEDSLFRADMIITVSEHTKRALIEHLNIGPQKINVIYSGIDPIYFKKLSKDRINTALMKYGISAPYFLYVGIIDPRKNIRRIIEAYNIFVRKYGVDDKLLLIGGMTSRGQKELSIIDELDLKQRVFYLGYVSQDDMPSMYSGAKTFLFPSLYEGFGFPVLEAMACGTPVITSNISALPEIAGDSAIYVSPRSTEDIVSALHTMYNDVKLRNSIVKKGLIRARSFQWQKTAIEVIKCYHDLLK